MTSGNALSGTFRPSFAIVLLNSLLVSTPASAETPVTLISPASPLPRVVAGKSQLEKDAAADLCHYLSRITGRKLRVSSAYDKEKIIIHVGRDAFVDRRVAEIDKIRADGFVMQCLHEGDKHHLVLAGKFNRSAQWAVERFLREHCGVRWLFPDRVYGEVVPRKKTIVVDRNLAQRIEPDYISRANCGMYYFTPRRRLLRLGPYGYRYGDHALQHIFAAKEFRRHPEWFAHFGGKRQWWSYGNGWQICTTNPGTVKRAVEYVDDFFKRNPQSPVVSIGQNDGNGWCECANCKKFVNSFNPPYSISERWFHWVNLVAREVGKKHPGKWVEAMAYSHTSNPTRFKLEPNVAITKTFVLDGAFQQALQWKKVCRSINLYSYMYGSSFLGFRHYPNAAQKFLKWGHERLGALAHVTECGGDWTFDGPKYYYIQALQWDVNANVDRIMDEFCAASYGRGAKSMRAFWDRLEKVYQRRQQGPYRKKYKDWLFYQWVSWSKTFYVQPNDEFRNYTLADVAFLDRCISTANKQVKSPGARFRMARMAEAWAFQRSLLISFLKFYPVPLKVAIKSEKQAERALRRAKEIAAVRKQRWLSLAKMRAFPHINPRITNPGFWSWGAALTIFGHENTLLDELCTAVSDFRTRTADRSATMKLWRGFADEDDLYEAAQAQLRLLSGKAPTNRLKNGDFEAGKLNGWHVDQGSIDVVKGAARKGNFAAGLLSRPAVLSQKVSVAPLERYRLTVWARCSQKPQSTVAVPLAATVQFHDGQQRIFSEPARCVSRVADPSSNWVRLRLSVSVPPRADSATIQLTSNANSLWDDAVFERIRSGPSIKHGQLQDRFAGKRLDFTKWSRVPGTGGWTAPRIEQGWLNMAGKSTHSIASLARFNNLIKYRGNHRYRLRFRTASVPAAIPGSTNIASFSITNTRQPTTRMLWYLYFSDANRQRPMLSNFNDEAGTRKVSNSWNFSHLNKPAKDLWVTIYFDPDEVTVYGSLDGFDDSKKSLVCRYKHQIANMTAGGSVYFTLYRGNYKFKDLSIRRGK